MSGTTQGTDPISAAWGRIPNWVGFGAIIAAGVVMIVVGAIVAHPAPIAFGVATIASAVIGWATGAQAEPKVDPKKKTFGGTVKKIGTVPWLVIFGLYVAAAVVTIATV